MSVKLIGPDGGEYEIADPSKVPAAVKLGYRLADAPTSLLQDVKEGATAVGQSLTAGAEGALEGFAPGLVGAALHEPTNPASETPTEAKVRRHALGDFSTAREEHPIAHGVGELGGALVSPLNKVQGAIAGGIGATTALGRVGANIAGGAGVGSLYGAGNAVTDAALGNHELTAEKLLAGIGLGGLLGGGAAGIGSGLEESVRAFLPKAAEALSGLGSREGLADFADERWLKAGGGIKSHISKIPEMERPAVANVIREAMTPAGKVMPAGLEEASASIASERDAVAKQLLEQAGVGDAGGLTSRMNRDEAAEAVGKAIDSNGARMGEVFKKADALGAQPSYSGVLRRVDDFEASLNPAERRIVSGAVENARSDLTEMGLHPPGSPKNSFGALNDLKSTLQGNINYKAESTVKNQLEKQLVGVIRDELDTQLAPQIGSDLSKEFLDAKSAFGALSQAEKSLGRKASTGADAIRSLVEGSSLAEPSLAGKLSALDHATVLVKHGLDQRIGNRFISPSDYAMGIGSAVAHGTPGAGLMGLAGAIGHKLVRERGSAVIAKLADKIARSPQLTVAARSLAQKLPESAPFMGQYAAPIAAAFATSPAEGLATHLVYAQANPDYQDAAQKGGLLPETPEETAHAMTKAGSIAALHAAIEKHDKENDAAIKAVFKGEKAPKPSAAMDTQDFGSKRMRRDASDSHAQRVSEIRQLATDPSVLLDRMTKNLGGISDVAPNVSQAMTKTAYAAVQYLASQSQEPPKAGPLAPEWVQNESELHAFSQKLEAVQNPSSTLRHAAARTLTQDQVDAVAAVYPGWYQATSQKMLADAMAHPEMPYASRLMVSMFTGVDLDGSLGSLAATQAAIAASNASSPNPNAVDSGKSPMTLASRTAMPSEAKAMKET